MGSQQSVIRFLVQDNEFSDVFTRYHLCDLDCINYLCGKKINFTGKKNININTLINHLQLTKTEEIPTIMSDKNHVLEYDTESLTEQIKEDLKTMTSEGFDLDLIVTGRPSPIIDIFTDLIKKKYISPGKINIYIVICNDKYNDKILFQSLYDLQQISHENAITLNINEFNAFSSIGGGFKNWTNVENIEYKNCFTSEQFSKEIFELSPTNLFAKDIINYGINTHSVLINKLVNVVNNSLVTMETLGCDISDIKCTQDSINFYINDIIEDSKEPGSENLSKVLNIEGCQKLSTDLQKIIDKTSYELQRINDATDIPEDDSKFIKEKLNHIFTWFTSKERIIKNNLVHFPLYNLATVLLVNNSTLLSQLPSYGIKKEKLFHLVKNKPEGEFITINHHVCSETPANVLTGLENLILDVVKS
jgi:hypothetical protein